VCRTRSGPPGRPSPARCKLPSSTKPGAVGGWCHPRSGSDVNYKRIYEPVQQAVELTAPSVPERKFHPGDAIFAGVPRASGIFVLLLLGSLILSLFIGGLPAFRQFGANFLVSAAWDPVKEVFGAGVSIYGTLLTSVLAMILAVPLAFGIAFYLTELAPAWLKQPVGVAVE